MHGCRTIARRIIAMVMVFAAVALAAPRESAPQDEAPRDRPPQDRAAALAAMQPYDGEIAAQGAQVVDVSTLRGKVMCGYQGWFTAPGDGSGRGWSHYGRNGKFAPGQCSIDLWPDVSELADDEKFPTDFRDAAGNVASVFSSHRRPTVVRHFRWMQEYGIDGAFVQRFAVETRPTANFHHVNTVLANCRAGANLHGRAYAVMYDLSGLRRGEMSHVIEDWKLLRDRMRIGRDERDRAYLRHGGRPVVAVWGIGFNDDRGYTLDECEALVRFLKEDATYGDCTVMLGVPTGWRTLDRDCVADPKLHDIIRLADIVSPWTVGRYDSPRGAQEHLRKCLHGDMAWCQEHAKDYLPVVFPGFSWHNLKRGAKLDQIPRRKGEFLWAQYAAARDAGAVMVYQAMFDELDEGTAIFKCTDTPPVGASRFLTNEGLQSDHYLWLTGMGGKLIRGEIEPGKMPERPAERER